ncbi:amino acid permease 3-like protein [Tanacetum coccineum]
MGQETTTRELKIAGFAPQAPSKFFDDDGRLKRTGTLWTALRYYKPRLLVSGRMSFTWSDGLHLGWIAGLKRALSLLICGFQVKICRFIQYLNLVGVAIGYTIAASISMIVSGTPYIIMFGIVEIIFSQIPYFDQISWLSMLSAAMSFTYSSIGIGLGISKVVENGKIKGSLTGISIGKLTLTQKIWRSSQALGAIAFAYSYSLVLIEIQDTIKSQPAEHKTMKKATLISVATTTVFYMFCGCFGYAAFGDMAPGNILTGFGFYNPYWLIDIANGAIVIHLIGAYQVLPQPLFAFVENTAARYFPESKFINDNIEIPIPFGGYKPYKLNMFRLV